MAPTSDPAKRPGWWMVGPRSSDLEIIQAEAAMQRISSSSPVGMGSNQYIDTQIQDIGWLRAEGPEPYQAQDDKPHLVTEVLVMRVLMPW